MMITDSYYKSRYTWNKHRTVVWKEIVRYVSNFISPEATVLDIGAGYCDFINNVVAKNKIAIDTSSDFKKFASSNVLTIQSNISDIKIIKDKSVNVVFASNLLEHLSDEELDKAMNEIKRVLIFNGRLILMQPNYRLVYKRYFDDPTHKKIFSDESLRAFLVSYGFDIELSRPRFLPFSFKSIHVTVPFLSLIVRMYLYSPIKPFAGQMLFIAKLK